VSPSVAEARVVIVAFGVFGAPAFTGANGVDHRPSN
jgi:hypothetical protein